jgi:aminopeptidase N
MNKTVFLLTLLVYSFAWPSLWAEQQHTLLCRHWSQFPGEVDTSTQRYPTERQVDVLDLSLDVTPDFKNRRVSGTATITFQTMLKPVGHLRLDAFDLEIKKITSGPKIASWENTDRALLIRFEKPIPAMRKGKISITYEAEPVKGLYFRTPELGYKKSDMHIWTQGETIEARHWFPCFDAPNEFFTSSMTCHVPKDMTVLSNGKKTGEKIDPKTGLKAVTWIQEKPHVNYLISLVAGYFERITEKHGDLSMSFWTPPSEFPEAANSFRETKQCMEYFEKEIGVPYPWAKYDQVCVHDFNWGGMENTSLSTLNVSTLFSLETENIRSSQGLVAHELAHQWFGDLVTCKDWSHIWLNEGFATYYTHLFAGHKDGRDQMLYGLYRDMKSITGRSNDVVPMVNRKYDRPSDMFRKYGYMSYSKGSWVLHMLRSSIGPDLFRKAVKSYLEKHRHGNVITENLRSALEEASGRTFDRFFDQYVYHAHHPEFKISYSWDSKAKLAKLSVKQEQKVEGDVMLFELDLPIRFKVGDRMINRNIPVNKDSEDFYFPLPAAPKIVRIDPELTLLAKTDFSPPVAMLHAQLADPKDVIGRLLAVEALGKRKDKTSVEKLKDALAKDSFYGVRVAASKALRGIDSELAFETLVSSLKQKDARVRRQVVSDIGSFYKPAALAALKKSLQGEKNPAIRASVIRALAGFGDPGATGLIRKALSSTSYRHQLADAAVSALRTQDDPAEIDNLLGTIRKDSGKFTSRGHGSALRALAYLSRNENDKSTVRRFLIGRCAHPTPRVKQAALDALGELGDPKAIATLEKFAQGGEGSPEREKAEKAIEKLRAGRKPVDDFKNLRKEVNELKKSNESLGKELEDLKKRLEATYSEKPKGKEKKTD